uniref:C-type lectin domain-containing protein n=1 Tax=Periophthalmus magnuspinnatus TaxID=409849 RepID=A0A3B4BED7_9GOBI
MTMAKNIFITIFLGLFKGPVGKYIHVDMSQTWSEAQSYCQTKYSDLAVVNSQKDHELLVAVKTQDLSGWIGLHRDDVNVSLWKWSGEGKMRYQNWAKDQPNNYEGRQNVVRMMSSGKWNDYPQGYYLTFYCYIRNNGFGKNYLHNHISRTF